MPQFASPEADEGDHLTPAEGRPRPSLHRVESAEGGVQVRPVPAQVEEAGRRRGHGTSKEDPGGLHRDGLPPDSILLVVKEEGDGDGTADFGGGGIEGEDPAGIMELHVSQAELCGPLVGLRLGVFAGS